MWFYSTSQSVKYSGPASCKPNELLITFQNQCLILQGAGLEFLGWKLNGLTSFSGQRCCCLSQLKLSDELLASLRIKSITVIHPDSDINMNKTVLICNGFDLVKHKELATSLKFSCTLKNTAAFFFFFFTNRLSKLKTFFISCAAIFLVELHGALSDECWNKCGSESC